MSKSKPRLTREEIIRALTRLGELSLAQNSKVEIAIYGGTVMMLAYNCRSTTKDVDAIFHPEEIVSPLIRQVADELDIPEDWMNNGVKNFAAEREAKIKFEQLQIPGLVITRPSAKYLLAMKCMAARPPTPFRSGDIDDIRFLLKKMEVSSVKQVESAIDGYYYDRVLPDDKRQLVEELIKEVRRENTEK